MSLNSMETESGRMIDSAEKRYREAFERLKINQPILLPKGSLVTQNNIAKEAGCDPSALKKSRFPTLIAEIQKYLEIEVKPSPPSVRQVQLNVRKKNRDLRDRLVQITQQRDHLASLLSEADNTIIELYQRIEDLNKMLPKSNIVSLENG